MDRAAFAFSTIEALDRAKTVTAALGELARATRAFGLEHFIIAGIPAPDKKLAPYVLMHNWPAGWFERYNSLNYLHSDPVIRKLRSSTKPTAWSEAPYDVSKDVIGHAVMMEAREFRLNNGLSVPIYTLSGDQAAASFGGSRFELTAEDRAALHLIAIYGHARAQELSRPPAWKSRSRPMLSAREIEVMKWVAAGMTSDAIAERLGIAHSTVETHILHACQKLDAMNRTQAVAEAIRARLIP